MNLGDRIKRYEATSNIQLVPNSYIILRIDGKCFHTFTKNMEKPFDKKLIESMITAGEKTAKQMDGFVLGYHQSDEFTFLITDTQSHETQLWFDGKVQKLCSITASMFTAHFNAEMGGTVAVFDCRAFNVPKDDVPNVFVWRQQDWERNSLQMFTRAFFSHKELHKKNMRDMHDMLHNIGQNWADLPDYLKNGTFIYNDGLIITKKLNYDDIMALIKKIH